MLATKTSAVTVIPPLVLDAHSVRTPVDPDEDDALWLERKVNAWSDGVRLASEAAMEIARNWIDGRRVGRLYPDQTVYDFLEVRFGAIRLPREDRNDFIVKLVGSGMSARKAAKLAGVNNATATRAVANATPIGRKARPEPTPGQRLAKIVDDILGSRATLQDHLAEWLATDPPAAERDQVIHALDRLVERAQALTETVQ